MESRTSLKKPHIVIHDIPKHRCPVCQHICHTTKSRASQRAERAEKEGRSSVPHSTGRPPTSRKIIVEILRQEASYDRPMSGEELKNRLDVGFVGLHQIIYRARHIDHAPIKLKGSTQYPEGYYLDERQ